VKDLVNYNNILKVLVTGGSGQIGSEIRAYQKNYNFLTFFPSSSEFDLTDSKKMNSYLNSNSFDIILNLAAYTSVDTAEHDKKISDEVNHIGPKFLAEEANKRNIGLIHTSTDYVFGEKGSGPYKYSDTRNPINHYGRTKSSGEIGVLSNHNKSLIIRLASVFSEYGNNFVKTITLMLLKENEVRVVSDQLISLTYACDFSRNLNEIIDFYKNLSNTKQPKDRVFHFASPHYTNWFSVSKIIYDEIETFNQKPLLVKLIPIQSDQWNSAAPRSLDTRLKVNYKFLDENNIKVSTWEESVRLVVRKTLADLKG